MIGLEIKWVALGRREMSQEFKHTLRYIVSGMQKRRKKAGEKARKQKGGEGREIWNPNRAIKFLYASHALALCT